MTDATPRSRSIRSMLRPSILAVAALLTCAAFAEDPAWVDDARRVANTVPPRLLAVLTAEIAKSGPAGAIEVCREQAPQMARAASEETGWNVRRVSLRNRNPKAVPDDWERAALADFDRRAAAGDNPAGLEKAEIVTSPTGRRYRYIKALPTQALCVQCHGTQEAMDPKVRERLATLYPDDRATGYVVGEIRGAITLWKPF